MIPNFYLVIKNDIFTTMKIRLNMKSQKYHYKWNIIIFEDERPTFKRAAGGGGRKVWEG